MTLARTLPAEIAPRFTNARRVVARTDAASFEVVVAEAFLLRLRGLAGLDARELVPLLFPRCRSLHTFGMRSPIDVVWLDLGVSGEVVGVDTSVSARRVARAPRRLKGTAALELPPGDADALGLAVGRRLELTGL